MMLTLKPFRLILTNLVFALVTSCSSSDSTTIAADFSAYGVKGTLNGQNVTLDLSGLGNCTTNVENMVIAVNASGASISPDPRTARDYSKPVEFTITAPDGTQAMYIVTVKGSECAGSNPAPTPIPIACTAAAIERTGYSLVFKGCDANNVATYYDKTECVRDNATGLIWQGQMPAESGHIRANDQYKTNLDSTIELQRPDGFGGGIAPTQSELDASTNSIGFQNAVNAISLCGSSTWRVPTKDELLGLVKDDESPKINNNWFPNTPQYGFYWTSTPYPSFPTSAFGVHFGDGSASITIRSDNKGGVLVRLVR